MTDYIKQLKPQRVFEWGSGESTLFFIELDTKCLASIEHNKEWFDKINQGLIDKNVLHAGYNYVPYEDSTIGSNPANPVHYKSASTELGEVNFKQYASIIDRYGDRKFDLILIDGMARASCLYHAASHVAEGGCIVLDNAERDYYMQNVSFLFEGWERILFEGYGPILDYQWKTLVLINKRKRHYE
jgi:hypothetical protein